MILPLLMGSVPSAIPACLDCSSWFWLGVCLATGVAIVLALGAVHFLKGK